jgi:hypothetical protein
MCTLVQRYVTAALLQVTVVFEVGFGWHHLLNNTHTHTHGEESLQKLDSRTLYAYGCSHEAAVYVGNQTSKQLTAQ